MYVNILGRGLIPGLRMLAPVKNVDLDQQQVARILKVKSLKVTLVDSPDLITKNNIAQIFAQKTETPAPKKEEKPVVKEVIEKAEEAGIEVEKKEETTEEVVESTPTEQTLVTDSTDELTLAEGLITEDTTYVEPTPVEETSEEEETTEEVVEEEKTSQNEIKVKKNKKNRQSK